MSQAGVGSTGGGGGGQTFTGTTTTVDNATSTVATLPLGSIPHVYTFTTQVGGLDPTNNIGASYVLVGAVRTNGTTATLIPGQSKDEFEETGMTAANVDISVSGNSAIFQVTGVTGHNMDWGISGSYTIVS